MNTRTQQLEQPVTRSSRNTADRQRIEQKQDPVAHYEDFIWALAGKFTDSPEEMAAAANEMFRDMRHYAGGAGRIRSLEDRLIAKIAWRRLLRFLQ